MKFIRIPDKHKKYVISVLIITIIIQISLFILLNNDIINFCINTFVHDIFKFYLL